MGGALVTAVENEQTVFVCRPRAWEVFSRESLGERWCFRCRKRRDFELTVEGEPMPTWYAPMPMVKCKTCGLLDGDLFPGRFREWDEA